MGAYAPIQSTRQLCHVFRSQDIVISLRIRSESQRFLFAVALYMEHRSVRRRQKIPNVHASIFNEFKLESVDNTF